MARDNTDSTKSSTDLTIFGKDISKIPCFKKSFTSGILTGIGGGFGFFFYSSNVLKSCNFAMGSYAVTTLGVYSYCRYKYAEKLQQDIIMKKALQTKILIEGTDLEKQFQKTE